MSYYDEDFYNEPSEYDAAVDQFKRYLTDSVKEEFVTKMNKLEEENESLQEVKKNFDDIRRDFDFKKRQLENEYQTLKSNVRRERLGELMKDFEIQVYSIGYESKKQPKCDKCNDNRQIPYTTPLGKETYETCDCDKRIHIYKPIPSILVEFSFKGGEARAWYQVKSDRYYDVLSYYEDSISGDKLITDESQFEDVNYYRVIFKTEELAQKYCDYKNQVVQS